MKIAVVVGARPQFIKVAAVSRILRNHYVDINEVLIHTGQHYSSNMSDVFFDELAIPRPDYNLGIGGGSHGQNTGRMIEKIEEVLLKEQPDWVLVYGDTDSTLAGALAAAKLHIPVAHVEAGLRSFNRRMPEEINRVLTDHISALLFAPTELACRNLLAEGVAADKIHMVGDVMFDAALFYKNRAMKPNWFDSIGFSMNNFVLCTIHRAENTDDSGRLLSIFEGLADAGLPVILPLHPRTKGKIAEQNIPVAENIHITDPVGYLEMVWLEMNCKLIATDSGGVQKEAYFHAKPCITLRDETEWVELVDIGVNRLVPVRRDAIRAALVEIPPSVEHCFSSMLYGSGDAASKIVDRMLCNSERISKGVVF
ncbi:MAG: UDP-N-acetylglucosamine 2-epimerase (non-hydrolyzing) [Gallionella sp.]|jgi:UDP-GlcNAc3NAcA epimerase